MADDVKRPVYPCVALPEEARTQRLLGLYPQRQEGLWMQRMRVPAGQMTADQWRRVAAIVRTLTPHEPLHLTTRQDIELHGLTADTVPQAERLLAEAGLDCVSACGDTVRNVTVCPCSGMSPDRPDLAPLGEQMAALLLEQSDAYSLPRKFKISLSACSAARAQPWINDLGFIALPQGNGWLFRVVIAGSLGAKPETGVELPQPVAPHDVMPLALAALRVFAAHGDRQNRSRARLRHARQRLGNETFLSLLETEFQRARAERQWPEVNLASSAVALAGRREIAFVNGDISPDQAEAVATLVQRNDLRVRITNWHRLAVFGPDLATLDAALAAVGLPTAKGPTIVACPGTRWCSRGLASTQQMALRLERELASVEADLLIAISGCPNGCAQSMVADIGLTGLVQGPEGQRREVWNIAAGGGRGCDARLAEPVATRLESEQAVVEVLRLVEKQRGVPVR